MTMVLQAQINAPRTQFLDASGALLAGGSVTTYIPGTFTPITTYIDADGSIANDNPATLDALGSVSIWADGLVRLIVKDALGNLIYDQVGGSIVPMATTPFKVYPRPHSAPLQDRLASIINLKTDYGCKGNNIDNDAPLIQQAVDEAEVGDFPIAIYCPPGLYATESTITVNKPITFIGDGPRNAAWTPRGNFDVLAITGNSTLRAANAGMRHIGVNAISMSGGRVFKLDMTQDCLFDDVLVSGAYNFMSIRQSGSIRMPSLQCFGVRGSYGLKAYGTQASRNGGIDRCDVLEIGHLHVEGSFTPGTPGGEATELFIIDGAVDTISYKTIRLLSGGRGARLSNTPGVNSEYVPGFALGGSFEVENTYLESIRLEACKAFNPRNLFCATSVSENGIYMGSQASNVRIGAGQASNHWKNAIYIDGAQRVSINDFEAFYNGRYSSEVFSGAYVNAGDDIVFNGGLFGKNTSISEYVEYQKYGIDNFGGTNVRASATNTRGNVTGGRHGVITADSLCI